MVVKDYVVQLEIAGPAAMFTRPDTGATPISYPVPTYSAAKGMFEAVARYKTAYIRPTKVEICKPIRFEKYVTNYGGPLRKANQIAAEASYQLPATILVDVCFRVHGVVEEISSAPNNNNHLHALQEIFLRRLQKGQTYYTPVLGWKEFVPSYFGPPREYNTIVQKDINLTIPSLLHTVFDRPANGTYKPVFRQDVNINEGVLTYA
ncbi:MAG TPA: CRISPR-associated protein Cas5 [Desulfitobacteriaceae bacterium]|nr:CRISPR-associated protein Cas5 [Desulfitobacteriaceae bacterium]